MVALCFCEGQHFNSETVVCVQHNCILQYHSCYLQVVIPSLGDLIPLRVINSMFIAIIALHTANPVYRERNHLINIDAFEIPGDGDFFPLRNMRICGSCIRIVESLPVIIKRTDREVVYICLDSRHYFSKGNSLHNCILGRCMCIIQVYGHA